MSTDRLDALLVEERNKLDANFFAHLQWEIDEQKRMKNSKLLGILEVVVQRACVEVETGQPEVALLSAVLQTANQMARREMYQRELVCLATASASPTPLSPSSQRRSSSSRREFCVGSWWTSRCCRCCA